MRVSSRARSGASIVEHSIILPVFLLLLIGFIIMALGVFRYQEVASLAREGARYASVRGDRYELSTGFTACTPAEVFDNAIAPRVVALDKSKLDYSVTWVPDKRQGSLVSVTLTYNWIPEAFFGGVNISSKSTMPMSY